MCQGVNAIHCLGGGIQGALAGLKPLLVQVDGVAALRQLHPAHAALRAQFHRFFEQRERIPVAGLIKEQAGVVDQQFCVLRIQGGCLAEGFQAGIHIALLAQCKTQQAVCFVVAPIFAQGLAAQPDQQGPVAGLFGCL